jgi:hypothetical protein
MSCPPMAPTAAPPTAPFWVGVMPEQPMKMIEMETSKDRIIIALLFIMMHSSSFMG